MIGPRRRRFVVVLGVLSLAAAGCSAGDGQVVADVGVLTADAATASAERAALTGGSRNRIEPASATPGTDPIDHGPGSTEGMIDGITNGIIEGEVEADGPVGSVWPSSTAVPVTSPPTSNLYPEITGEILPAAEGVKAMLSPTGVLLGVKGQTSAGYVVETPCGGVTQLAWGQPVSSVQVVLDPGHGGDEPGADGIPGLTEADLNLAVARRTAAVLTERSISVVLTRNGDYRIPVARRAALADAIAPDAFISIHHNTPASRPSPAPGTEVYVQSTSAQSLRLGGLLHQMVFEALNRFDVEWTSRDDAGVLIVLNDNGEDAYGIARHPSTPSVLIEMAYLGNEKEAVLLATPDYLEAAAVALADGIERYLTTEESGTVVRDTPRLFNPSGATGGSGGCVDPPLD